MEWELIAKACSGPWSPKVVTRLVAAFGTPRAGPNALPAGVEAKNVRCGAPDFSRRIALETCPLPQRVASAQTAAIGPWDPGPRAVLEGRTVARADRSVKYRAKMERVRCVKEIRHPLGRIAW